MKYLLLILLFACGQKHEKVYLHRREGNKPLDENSFSIHDENQRTLLHFFKIDNNSVWLSGNLLDTVNYDRVYIKGHLFKKQ